MRTESTNRRLFDVPPRSLRPLLRAGFWLLLVGFVAIFRSAAATTDYRAASVFFGGGFIPPPIYTTNEAPRLPLQPDPNAPDFSFPISTDCGTLQTSYDHFLTPNQSGIVVITTYDPSAIVAYLAADSVTSVNVLACGTHNFRFPGVKDDTYFLLLNTVAGFDWQVLPPLVAVGNLDFGTRIVGTLQSSTLTLTNNATNALQIFGVSFPPGFSGNTSGFIIPPVSSHDIVVTFSPGAAQPYNGQIVINDGNTMPAISVSGTGIAATRVLKLDGNLTFGSIQVNSSATASLTIGNSGNSALTVSNISLPPGFTGDWGGGSIPAGGSKVITITFHPTAAIAYGGLLSINSDASGSNTFPLSGTGSPIPSKIIELAGDLSFGDLRVNLTSTKSLRISNSGNLPLTVSAIHYPEGFSGNWAGGVISALGNQDITVTFKPVLPTDYGGTVSVDSDATGGISVLSASGRGTPIPTRVISLSGNLAFGNVRVGTGSYGILSITNNGNSALNVSSVEVPSGFSPNWTGGSIGPGTSRDVTIAFNPLAPVSYGGTVTVHSDATSGSSTILLSGTGTIPPTRIIGSSGNLAFGDVQVGSSKNLPLTILNTGTAPLDISSVTYPEGFSGNWTGGQIPAMSSRTLTVTFRPSQPTAYAASISIASDATDGASTIPVSGRGTPIPTRIIELSGNLAFGSVPVGTTKTSSLVISNAGNSLLTISNITYPPAVSGNWSGGTIPAGGSRTVTVSFTPAKPLTYNGNIVANSDATVGGGVFAVLGEGVLPTSTRIIGLSGNLAFGSVPVGTSQSASLTISNSGNSSLTVTALAFPNGYSADWLGGTIPAGAAQYLLVTFRPQLPISYNGALIIQSDATSGTSTIPLSGSGFAVEFITSTLQKPANGGFRLIFSSVAGKTSVLEASNDLRTWSELQRFQSSVETIAFTDSAPAGMRARFYRLHLEP